jgi:hypothetical protein
MKIVWKITKDRKGSVAPNRGTVPIFPKTETIADFFHKVGKYC